ncbi:MAG: hypothetical protein IT422_09545 [Pirellulaceae bacterium]|nr:hypothetical protein [Pirellulaceae bacterium]
MQQSSRPHPLDASDDDDTSTKSRWSKESATPSIAYQPLLKPSLRVAALATVVLLIGSVMTATFGYNSGGYSVSVGIFRFGGVVLALALAGVLVSFRIGSMLSQPQRRARRRAVVFCGYRGFVFSNLIGLGTVWTVLLCAGWGFGAIAAAVGSPLMLIGAGLLATMIFTHDGYLRAYAIGSLTALALQFSGFSNVASLILFNGGGFGRGFGLGFGGAFGRLDMLTISLGLTITIAIVSGLVSSGYVVALTSYARRQRELLQQQATDQTMLPTNHANERE